MPNIMSMSGTWPAQMNAKKLPMSTSVDAVRTLSDLYLFFCASSAVLWCTTEPDAPISKSKLASKQQCAKSVSSAPS